MSARRLNLVISAITAPLEAALRASASAVASASRNFDMLTGSMDRTSQMGNSALNNFSALAAAMLRMESGAHGVGNAFRQMGVFIQQAAREADALFQSRMTQQQAMGVMAASGRQKNDRTAPATAMLAGAAGSGMATSQILSPQLSALAANQTAALQAAQNQLTAKQKAAIDRLEKMRAAKQKAAVVEESRKAAEAADPMAAMLGVAFPSTPIPGRLMPPLTKPPPKIHASQLPPAPWLIKGTEEMAKTLAASTVAQPSSLLFPNGQPPLIPPKPPVDLPKKVIPIVNKKTTADAKALGDIAEKASSPSIDVMRKMAHDQLASRQAEKALLEKTRAEEKAWLASRAQSYLQSPQLKRMKDIDAAKDAAMQAELQRGMEAAQKRAAMPSILGMSPQTAFAAGGILIALGEVVEKGAEFEKQMSRVKMLAQATAEEFRGLAQEAMRAAKITGNTASEAAKVMGEFALAGFDKPVIKAGVEPALQLAAVGNIEPMTSTGILARTLSTFGMAGRGQGEVEALNQVKRAADVLAKAAAESQTDVKLLGDALKFAGPVARVAGKDIEETTAAIMSLSNVGLQGELAGTALRGMLLRTSDQSERARDVMNLLGLSFQDAAGNIKPIATIINDLQQKLKGFGSGQQVEILGKLFDMRVATGMAALLNSGADEVRRFEASLRSAGGEAARMSEEMLNNVAGNWNKLRSVLNEVAIGIFGAIAGPVSAAISVLRGLLEPIGMLLGAMSGLHGALVPIVALFAYWMAGISPMVAGIALLAGAGGALASAMDAARGAMIPLAAAFYLVGGPARVVITLALLLADALGFLKPVADFVGAAFELLLDVIRSLGEALGWLLKKAGQVVGVLLTPFRLLGQAVGSLFGAGSKGAKQDAAKQLASDIEKVRTETQRVDLKRFEDLQRTLQDATKSARDLAASTREVANTTAMMNLNKTDMRASALKELQSFQAKDAKEIGRIIEESVKLRDELRLPQFALNGGQLGQQAEFMNFIQQSRKQMEEMAKDPVGAISFDTFLKPGSPLDMAAAAEKGLGRVRELMKAMEGSGATTAKLPGMAAPIDLAALKKDAADLIEWRDSQLEAFNKKMSAMPTKAAEEWAKKNRDLLLEISRVEGRVEAMKLLAEEAKKVVEMEKRLQDLESQARGGGIDLSRARSLRELITALDDAKQAEESLARARAMGGSTSLLEAQLDAARLVVAQHSAIDGETQALKAQLQVYRDLAKARREMRYLESTGGEITKTIKDNINQLEREAPQVLLEELLKRRAEGVGKLFSETRTPSEQFLGQAGDLLSKLSVSPAAQASINNLKEQMAAFEKQGSVDALKRAQEDMEKLLQTVRGGVLDWKTFTRSVFQAGQALSQGLNRVRVPGAAGLEEGSREAVSVLNDRLRNPEGDEDVLGRVERLIDRGTNIQDEARRILSEIERNTKPIRERANDKDKPLVPPPGG